MINTVMLRNLRKEHKLNQQQLGDELGVTKVSVCCYEKGTRQPMLETFVKMVEFFKVEADVLLMRNHNYMK